MHKDFAKEYFDMQLREVDNEPAFTVKRVNNFEALVVIRAGSYLPVLRIEANDFDLEPPLIEFANPETGQRLEDHLWPTGSGIANGNNLYPGPMICITGNRTYHTHQSHLQDMFHLHRNIFTIKRIVERIARHITDGQYNLTATRGLYNANS